MSKKKRTTIFVSIVLTIGIVLFVQAVYPAAIQFHPPAQIAPQGSGSGLDSDMVDGLHAADLLASGASGSVLDGVVCGNLTSWSCSLAPTGPSLIGMEGGVSWGLESSTGLVSYFARSVGTGGEDLLNETCAAWWLCKVSAKNVVMSCASDIAGMVCEAVPGDKGAFSTPDGSAFRVSPEVNNLTFANVSVSIFGVDGGIEANRYPCPPGWKVCYKS